MKNYPQFFKNVLKSAHVPPSHTPEGFEENLDSAPIRTCILLAAILVHEFAHAFNMAYFVPAFPDAPREPFVGDSRNNEFGHAVVRYILGGIPYANSIDPPAGAHWERKWRLDAYAPFGIVVYEKWEQWAYPGANKKHLKEGVEDDFKSPVVSFPLPARQSFDYFTKEMWETKVPRYGLDALRFVKIPEWTTARLPGHVHGVPGFLSTLR
jgi:hypothetical protein